MFCVKQLFNFQQSQYCFPVLIKAFISVWASLSVCVSSLVCVGGVKLCWMKRTRVLSHLDLFGPNKRGPCLTGPLFCLHWGLRAMNRRCLLTTHTWAPLNLGPLSLSLVLSPSIQPLRTLSFTTLRILSTSLPGHGLAYFYLLRSLHFDVDCVGPFHRSCVHLEMAPVLNPKSVYEYTFHKQDM